MDSNLLKERRPNYVNLYAYLLAKTGLLAGNSATTHHSAYMDFAMTFPDIQLKRGARFVEDGNLASSGGLSSGIDLALRVVARYFGQERAETTADVMNIKDEAGWIRIPIKRMPRLGFQLRNTLSVPCARWMLIVR